MVMTILGIVAALLAAIPIFYKWFPAKTVAQKEEQDAKTDHQEMDDFKKTGRPD